MIEIIRKLKQAGLINNKGPKLEAIQSLTVSQISDLSFSIEELIRNSYQKAKSPVFSHTSSLSLGGDPSGCANFECRLSRIKKLARYASLYCDEVFVSSFLANYKDPDGWTDLEQVQRNLYNDLVLFNELIPLIKEGIIKFFSPRTNLCFSCQAQKFLGIYAGNVFDKRYRALKNQYLENLTVNCEYIDDEYEFEIDGAAPFMDHPIYIYDDVPPQPIAKRPTILNKINRGLKVNASKTLRKELGFYNELAHDVATNAILGLVSSATLETSFLTENDIHVTFLNSLHSENTARQKNIVALNHLSSIIPFVEEVQLKDVVKLRRREEEAFISYRKALNEAIINFGGVEDKFTEKDAKELHADVINPKLIELDKKVKSAKRDLIKTPFRSIAGVVGVLSFGLLTGLITPDLAAIAKTIGLVKVGSDMIKHTMALGDKEEKIKSEHFYFLWKLRQRVK